MSEEKKIPTLDISLEESELLLTLLELNLRAALEANERAKRISSELWDREFTV